jgi:hypothetical protein
MATPAREYLEAIEDDSRANFQFDQTGGTARCPYYFTVTSSGVLQFVIQDILGFTNPFVGTLQRLSRLLPVTHPVYPYLYAQRISSMVGKGSASATKVIPVTPINPAIGTKPIANYNRYTQYEAMVEFGSRTYPLIEDEAFTPTLNGTFYAKDGTANNFTYAPEWCRYCDYELLPQDNTLQGQSGSMYLVVGASGGSTQYITYTSPPWMWLPDQILKVKWYQVPYRYITSNNSYIAGGVSRNWRGRVNQNTWWNWPAGSLLYLGYNVTKYTPPTSNIGTYPTYGGTADYAGGVPTKTSKLRAPV